MPSLGPMALDWLASGAFVLLLGGLITFADWTWLLAGYDESTSSVSDETVRNVAGNTVLRVGIAATVVGVLASVTNPPPSLGALVGGAILVDVVRLIYRLNTLPSEEATPTSVE